MCWIWSARMNVLLIRRTTMRHRVHRIERLVRIHLAGDVRVGGDLPARQVDRLQAGLHLLQRLVAGQRAQRVDERLVVDQLPQLFGAAARERVLDVDRAAQAHDVLRRVAALDALPARILRPVLLEPCRFEIVVHRCSHRCVVANPDRPAPRRAGTLVSGPAAREPARSGFRSVKRRRAQPPGASLHGPARIARPVGRAWMGCEFQALLCSRAEVGRRLLVTDES